MVRQSFATLAFVALGLSRGPGCEDVDAPGGGPNAPCTRSSDCVGALACLEGVCRERDEPSDAAPPDAQLPGEKENRGAKR